MAQVRVGDVHIELVAAIGAPTNLPKPSTAPTRNDVVSEYGGTAVEKLLDDDGDDYVPAVKA